MENFISIFVFLGIGMLLQRAKFPDNFATSLNLLLLNVSLPAMVLLLVPSVKLDTSLLTPAITPYFVFALSVASALFLVKYFNLPRDMKASLLLILPLGNTSFFGFPMIEALMNKQALSYAIIYDQFGTFLFLCTYGAIIVAIYSGTELNIKNIIIKIFTFPAFLAFIFSFLLPPLDSIHFLLHPLASMLTPLAMISVGFSLKLRVTDYKKPFFALLAIKLILIPLIVIAIFKLLSLDSTIDKVTILETAMPTMITAGAIASLNGFAPRFSNAIVGYGILFAFISLPLIKWISF